MKEAAQSEYLRAILEAATRLLSHPDREDMLASIVDEVTRVFPCRQAKLYLLERATRSLVLATRSPSWDRGDPLGQRCSVGQGTAGMAAQTGEPSIVPVSPTDGRSLEAAFPLRAGTEIIGAVQVLFSPDRPVEEPVLRLMEFFTNLCGLAIHTRRLIRMNREGQERLHAVLNAAESAILLVDSEGVVRLANGKAGELFGLDPAVIHGMLLRDVFEQSTGWRLQGGDEFEDWLSVSDAISGLSLDERDIVGKYELEMTRDGKHGYFSVYVSPVENERGHRLGKVLVVSDVTDLRKAQRLLLDVSEAAAEINRDLEIGSILEHLMGCVTRYLPADEAAILRVDDRGRVAVLGATSPAIGLGEDFAHSDISHVLQGDFMVDIISEIDNAAGVRPGEESPPSVLPGELLAALATLGMRSAIAVPLHLSGKMIGIWVLCSKQPRAYTYSDMSFLEPIAGHLAVAVNNSMLLAKTRDMYRSSIRALAAAVDARDRYTMHHSEHVARLSRAMAEELGMDPSQVEIVELAGLVHDLGKVGIPDAVLNKPGPLDAGERSIMMSHAHIGASILSRTGMMEDLVPLVRHHHEWYDGSGYPDGLKGSQVPMGAWILAVADAFDTMISDRAYRSRKTLAEARAEIRRMAGAQFHPEVVDALERVIERALRESAPWFRDMLETQGEVCAAGERLQGTLAEEAVEPINAREVRVLLRIVEEMRKLLDIRELMHHVVNIIHEEMGYKNCAILLPDDSRANLVVVASTGLSGGIVGLRVPRGMGISWWVMEHCVPQNIPDVTQDPRFYGDFLQVRSELYTPLVVGGRCGGILLLQDDAPCAFDARDVKVMGAVAGHISQALEVAELHDRLKKSAQMDPLTGVYNRKHFMTLLDDALREAAEKGEPSSVCVVLLDLDDLRVVNNSRGHLVGDEVLTVVASSLKDGVRSCDVVGRYGGDEFVLLFPGASREAVEKRVHQIVEGWRYRRVRTSEGTDVPLPGGTFALAVYPDDGEDVRSLLRVADERLLERKRWKAAGRRGEA